MAPAVRTPAKARTKTPAKARMGKRPAKSGEKSAERAAHGTRNRKKGKRADGRAAAQGPKAAARAPGATTQAPETTPARPASEADPASDPAGEPELAHEPGPGPGSGPESTPALAPGSTAGSDTAPDPEAGATSATEHTPSEPEPPQKPPEQPSEQTQTQAHTQTQTQAQTQRRTRTPAQPPAQTHTQTRGEEEAEPVTPVPRSGAQPQTGSARVPAPTPRSEPEPEPEPWVEVVAEVPGPVEDFVRSARRTTALPDDPVAAFDELYLWQARALTRQALLLCGHRRVAERAVRWAFHQAWQHWPKVLAGGDPTRTVRATVYDYALSPWHQFHPRHRRPEVCRGSSADSAVLEAFLELPRSYRAALLLHYGLGLTLTETAAEAECSTEAAAGRIAHGRAALEESWPPLARSPRRRRGAVLAGTLRELAAAQPVRPVPAQLVRGGSARTTRLWTRASVGLTAAVAAATTFTLLTTQTGGSAPAQDRERVPRVTFAPAMFPGGPATGPGAGGTGAGIGTGTGARSTPTTGRDSAGSSVRAPAGGAGQAYLPQLRSTNTRGHLRDLR